MTKTPLERPAESAGALYYPTPVTPEEAFQAIGRLRKEARDEIDRLIGFLDKTDDYVSRELEDGVDDGQIDDNELEGDDTPDGGPADNEPSLGSGAVGEWSSQTQWASRGKGEVDAEDEHDGCEQDSEDEGAQCEDEGAQSGDDEPSLGWTVDGVLGRPSDTELQDYAPVKPQHRTDLGKGVHAAEQLYYSGRRGVLGLTVAQADRMRERVSPVRHH